MCATCDLWCFATHLPGDTGVTNQRTLASPQ
nr:MAG TPA: hypothetical protein [Caudoviricetes sp.]